MDLIWNTRQLLAQPSQGSQSIEYHAVSAREVYDKTILTADRYSSGAAEWVVHGDRRFYTISVTSRPFRSTPQLLCLSFGACYYSHQVGNNVSSGYFYEDPARDVFALLAVFARAPIALLGVRRLGSRPIQFVDDVRHSLRAEDHPIPPIGINSDEFSDVLRGLAAPNAEGRANAVLAAARFYSSALLAVQHDVSTAYISLVMALECVAAFHYKQRVWPFDETPKFDFVARKLKNIEEKTPEHSADVAAVRANLLSSEYFIAKKVIELVAEFASEELWTRPDDRYPAPVLIPSPERSAMAKAMRKVYDARSQYVHAGRPFPPHVEVGRTSRVPIVAAMEVWARATTPEASLPLPTFAWFERLTADVLLNCLRCWFAPERQAARVRTMSRKAQLGARVRALPPKARQSLQKLVGQTVPFLNFAVINPHFKNGNWSADVETTELLLREGLIGGTGTGMESDSWLLDRDVGEAVGAEFFGQSANPFVDQELLLPRAFHQTSKQYSEPPSVFAFSC